MKRDVSIQMVRIIAMLMIVACHILNVSTFTLLKNSAQFFNVGVYIFLFVSGYLYGKKNISDNKKFLVGRFKRLFIPIYIFILYISIFYIISDNFSLFNILSYIFGLQYFVGVSVNGLAHLWFISIIMLCYILTVPLNKYKDKIFKYKNIILITVFSLSILLTFVNNKIGQILFYTLIYLIGYTTSKDDTKIYLDFIFFIIVCISRIILRKVFDGQALYNVIIVSICQIVITICIFNIFRFLFKNNKSNKIIDYLDKLSFYIYIVHYHFITGPICLYVTFNNYIFATIILIISSFIIANILMKISDIIIRKVKV